MDGFSVLDQRTWRSDLYADTPEYKAGHAFGWLYRGNKQAATNYPLAGRLYLAKSGWLLLSVPNALVRGVFDAMAAPGTELPLAGVMNVPNVGDGVLNAHISVMTADEVNKVGVDNINERGHMFAYRLGGMKEIAVKNVDGVSKVWVIEVSSPELTALRKSYGLSPLPNGDHPFHITVACRRKKVLQDNDVRKAAADLTKLAPKWTEREHLLAALPKHLSDTQSAIETQGNVDKEMTDLALIANAWLKSQKQKELLAARLKKFQETAAYPSLAAPKIAAELPWRERVEVLTRHPQTGKIYGGVWKEDKSFAAPGGGIDPGETPEQAAVRELMEETGIQATNPVRLPIGPVDNAWSDDYRQRTGRNFAGSRTHFVAADFVKRLRNKNLDAWSATNRRFYTPEQALETMKDKNYMAVAVAEGRRQALQHIIDGLNKKTAAVKDKLPGGQADGVPDSKFPPKALAEGAKHEHEHTSDDQAAKEIAKDHLSEDPDYYEKVKEIEKAGEAAHKDVLAKLLEAKTHSDNKRYDQKTQILRRLMQQSPQDWVVDDPKPKYKGVTHKPTNFRLHADPTAIPDVVKVAENVYMNQLRNMYSMRRPIQYDYNKPVFENVKDQLMEVKRRGDFMIQARQNHQRYMAALSPQYRYQLAMKAMRGEMEQPSFAEQAIYNHGDHFLNMALGRPK